MNKFVLSEGERLDDLECGNLMLIQHVDKYAFTSDAVLLANIARVSSYDNVCDLGTGSGVIALLIAQKYGAHVTGVELQPYMADMAQRSVRGNGMENLIDIICADIKSVDMTAGKFDVVVCNPPYFKANTGEHRLNYEKAVSRHEIALTMQDVLACSGKLLKYGGMLYMVMKTERMAELIVNAHKYKLITKKIVLIYPKASKNADTFIAEFKKNAKDGMKIERITVYEEDGSMTEKAKELYGK